jgi:flavodoxin
VEGMKILVAYYSETGNTRKVAEAISEQASINHDATLKKTQDVSPDELKDYDLLFLGSTCHDADLARPFKRFLDTLPQNSRFKLAGFFTHATYTPNHTTRRKELFVQWAGKCAPTFEQLCQEKEIKFLGYFHCMGAPSKPIEAFIHREIIPSDKEWKEYLPEVKTHPNSQDLEDAKHFALKVISKY